VMTSITKPSFGCRHQGSMDCSRMTRWKEKGIG
jgi:hypothetical protein